MSKKRVTIYVKEEDWTEIRIGALKSGQSAGDYLLSFYNPVLVVKYGHKDLIETVKVEACTPKSLVAEIPVESKATIEAANERLLKKRKEIPNAIKTASDLPDRYRAPEFSGGVPKAKWKGVK